MEDLVEEFNLEEDSPLYRELEHEDVIETQTNSVLEKTYMSRSILDLHHEKRPEDETAGEDNSGHQQVGSVMSAYTPDNAVGLGSDRLVHVYGGGELECEGAGSEHLGRAESPELWLSGDCGGVQDVVDVVEDEGQVSDVQEPPGEGGDVEGCGPAVCVSECLEEEAASIQGGSKEENIPKISCDKDDSPTVQITELDQEEAVAGGDEPSGGGCRRPIVEQDDDFVSIPIRILPREGVTIQEVREHEEAVDAGGVGIPIVVERDSREAVRQDEAGRRSSVQIPILRVDSAGCERSGIQDLKTSQVGSDTANITAARANNNNHHSHLTNKSQTSTDASTDSRREDTENVSNGAAERLANDRRFLLETDRVTMDVVMKEDAGLGLTRLTSTFEAEKKRLEAGGGATGNGAPTSDVCAGPADASPSDAKALLDSPSLKFCLVLCSAFVCILLSWARFVVQWTEEDQAAVHDVPESCSLDGFVELSHMYKSA